jgi:dipeptidyl aminopeptidase/acylaminoacyl peptidase
MNQKLKKPTIRIYIKIVFGISTLLVASYLSISAYAAHILSTPKRNFNSRAAAAFSVSPQEIKITTLDGLKIASWFIPTKASDKALILVHGMNSSRTAEFDGHFAEFGAAMQRQGFTVLMIDLRGHGQSSNARFTFGITEKQDIISSVNWLESQGFKTGKIGVLGVSMGAASAIRATAEDSYIGALVIDSAFAKVYPIIQTHWQSDSGLPNIFLPSTMMFGHLLTGYDLTSSQPVTQIAQISPRPILIIHSVADPYTPVSNADQLKSANPSAEYWQTSAPQHAGSYNLNPQAYVNHVTDFFNRTLTGQAKNRF